MTCAIVKYIGGGRQPSRTDVPWGGTTATNAALLAAFRGDDEFRIEAKFRKEFTSSRDTLGAIKEHLDGADITHVDDTTIIGILFEAGIIPDVMGPIVRSPVKDYSGWKCPYGHMIDEFYGAHVIRLGFGEEKELPDRVTLIRHGIDTEKIRPVTDTERIHVLWAGDSTRFAKNFPVWERIIETPLPEPYEWRTLSRYNVEDYWEALKTAAIVVNTSRFESFCCAMAEARASGVPVIYRECLHGPGVQRDGEYQVQYDANSYLSAILGLLDDSGELAAAGVRSRQYAEENMSLDAMREDVAAVYRDVLKEEE